MVSTLWIALTIAIGVTTLAPVIDAIEEQEWTEYHAEAMAEYADEFTALFNSYETKWSKNGRLMLRQGDSGSYRFVKKG
jgi:hypothetical protein